MVRAADSKLKSRGLESRRERLENFLLQGQLSLVFQDCSQTSSITVLMNLVFCASVSLMPALYLCFLVQGGGVGGGGQDCRTCSRFGGQSHCRDSQLSATDRQDTSRHAVSKLEAGGKYACSKLIRRWS